MSIITNNRKLALIGRNRILLLKKLGVWRSFNLKLLFIASYFNGAISFILAGNYHGFIAYSKGILRGVTTDLDNHSSEALHYSGKKIFVG